MTTEDMERRYGEITMELARIASLSPPPDEPAGHWRHWLWGLKYDAATHFLRAESWILLERIRISVESASNPLKSSR